MNNFYAGSPSWMTDYQSWIQARRKRRQSPPISQVMFPNPVSPTPGRAVFPNPIAPGDVTLTPGQRPPQWQPSGRGQRSGGAPYGEMWEQSIGQQMPYSSQYTPQSPLPPNYPTVNYPRQNYFSPYPPPQYNPQGYNPYQTRAWERMRY